MLDALRFVASAIARKDFVPELTHFKIKDERVTAFNGQLALSSSIDVDLNVQPHAIPMINAIRACQEAIALHVTPAGKLAVRSGKFRSFINCLAEEITQFVQPEGESIDLGEQFLPGVKALAPLMGVDASRPWAMGIKLHGQSMYATNNVMLAEFWHGHHIPVDAIIPAAAINELLRIDQEPTRVQISENSISFWFGEDRWMRSQLLIDGGWPTDRVDAIMAASGNEFLPLPMGFVEAVEKMKPFLTDRGALFLTKSSISTEATPDVGTTIEVDFPQIEGMQAYHHRQLLLLAEVADSIDWTNYPKPCQFRKGERMRGVVVGQKV